MRTVDTEILNRTFHSGARKMAQWLSTYHARGKNSRIEMIGQGDGKRS